MGCSVNFTDVAELDARGADVPAMRIPLQGVREEIVPARGNAGGGEEGVGGRDSEGSARDGHRRLDGAHDGWMSVCRRRVSLSTLDKLKDHCRLLWIFR